MVVDTADHTDAPVAEPKRPRRPAIPVAVGLLVLAWAIPVLCRHFRIDWLIPALAVVGVASLLRAGSTVLDRLVLSVLAIAGWCLALAPVFTFWPYRLSPVAIGGAGLTTIVLAWVATGRRPRLPRRVTVSDGLIAGTGVWAWFSAIGPALHVDGTTRLAYFMLTEDRQRQFSLFDAVHTTGGLPYLAPARTESMVQGGMGTVYPPGSHYLLTLADIFGRSTTAAGDPLREMVRYGWYVTASYTLLTVAVAWGVRWVAGPAAAGWRATLLSTGAGVFMATGFFTTMLWAGADSEIFALGFLALTIAVLIRAPASVGEQLLLAGAGLIVVAFSYTLLLSFAGVFAVAAVVIHRRRLRRHPVMTTFAVIVVVGLAALTVLIPASHGLTVGGSFDKDGFIIEMPRRLLGTIAAIAVLGVVAARKAPAVRAAGIGLALSTVILGLYLLRYPAPPGGINYYMERLFYAFTIGAIVVGGTAALALRSAAGSRRSTWLTRPAGSIAAGLVSVLIVGGLNWGSTKFRFDDLYTGPDTTWAAVWRTQSQQLLHPDPAIVAQMEARGVFGSGIPTLVDTDDNGEVDVVLTMVVQNTNRDAGLFDATAIRRAAPLTALRATGDLADDDAVSFGFLEAAIMDVPQPVRVVVVGDGLAARVEQFGADHPGKIADVIELRRPTNPALVPAPPPAPATN